MMSTGSSRTPRNLSTGNTDAIAVSILGEAAAAITMKFVKKDAEFFYIHTAPELFLWMGY